MSLPNYKPTFISEQEYLEDEKLRDIRCEYFDGEIFAMAGASRSHQRIVSNLVIGIGTHLKNTPCEVLSSDTKVRADNGKKFFYPDVLVSCTKGGDDSHFEESPRLIVEVLSDSTRKFDKNLKRQIYQTIPSLEEYILIEQDRVEIEVSRKSADWRSTYYFIDDEVTFESISLTLPVLELYARVENKELQNFFAKSEITSTEI